MPQACLNCHKQTVVDSDGNCMWCGKPTAKIRAAVKPETSNPYKESAELIEKETELVVSNGVTIHPEKVETPKTKHRGGNRKQRHTYLEEHKEEIIADFNSKIAKKEINFDELPISSNIPGDFLMVVTARDLNMLNAEEFNAVWQGLGLILTRRCQNGN